MAAKVEKNKCIGCGACVSTCPNGALSIKDGKCDVDDGNCISCGSCTAVCPCQAIKLPK
ncbi:MAG: 4Fe-4S binding protein [Mycoplasmataceae bacterium]|jgi:ferredoxin|nr:4Fe-4S binding protein [Mycoplasmataceae bacterium]